MPAYDFHCGACGPFEMRLDHSRAKQPQGCPACGRPAPRSYTPPLVRSPGGPFATASGAMRARVDRARTGQPVVSESLPAGRDLSAARHGHHGHAHGPRHPWAIGH